MKDNKGRDLRRMIKRFLAGKAKAQEQAFLEAYFNRFEDRENITAELSEEERHALREQMEASILQKISGGGRVRTPMLPTILKIAAAALIFSSVGVYVYHQSGRDVPVEQAEIKTDVTPGGNKAFLTLADGSRIVLDDARRGAITTQGSAVITKTDSGQVSYQVSAIPGQVLPVGVNTIETPRGGEFQVVLADGTRVWLNAASKLEYPTAFVGTERRVTLTGEAYFEVAKNASMPFRVASGQQVVEVLGTHFNISAYADEAAIKTTLLEGSVRVSSQQSKVSRLLVPGQQVLLKTGGKLLVSSVNTADVVAWREGYFVFANDNLEGVMRKISRWYDIEVQYTGNVTKEAFIGSVSKYEKLSEVLSVLELTGMVHFNVEGRRVTVMP